MKSPKPRRWEETPPSPTGVADGDGPRSVPVGTSLSDFPDLSDFSGSSAPLGSAGGPRYSAMSSIRFPKGSST
jgi:hypothetical protein